MNNPVPARSGASVAGFDTGAPGVTPPSRTGRQGVFLTDVIVELGFADKERIDEAEEAARSSGTTVEQLLLDKGVIDENQLSLAIAERNGLDHVDLEQFDIDMGVAEMIGRSMASRCGAVPIARAADGALIVAVQDPFDSLSVRRIETTTESEVRMAIAAASAIKRLIEQLPDEAPQQSSSPEPEVPRMKSQRELLVDDSEGSGTDDSEVQEGEDLAEPEPADSEVEEPEAAEPKAEEPKAAEPKAEEPKAAEPTVAEAMAAAAQAAAAQAGAADPEVTKPAAADPEVEEPKVEEPKAGESPEFFDGLSMDLGPMSMTGRKAESPAAAAKVEGGDDDVKRERELIETKGKVAELERRLEEVVSAAEEATATTEKLSALRKAIEESGD